MRSKLRTLTVTACAACACLRAGALIADAQSTNGVIGSYYPTQLVPGQTNVLHVALVRNNPVRSIEITPSAGITVTGTTSRDLNQGSIWWEFTIDVAKDAAAGPRTLVAVQETGRTAPVTLMIPNHVPVISNLRVLSAQMNQPMIDVQFAVSDSGGAFGDSPYVWFTLGCGPGKTQAGVVWGKMDNATMHASIPNPRPLAGRAGAAAAGNHCDLQLRTTDASGIDSNTITSAFDFN
jgi:hypothetical protein